MTSRSLSLLRSGLVASVALVACAGRPAAEAGARAPVAVSPSTTVPGTAPPGAPATAPLPAAPIASIPDPACTLEVAPAPRHRGLALRLPLRLRPDGPAVVTVAGFEGSIALPRGAGRDGIASVDLRAGGAHLRALVRVAEVPIHLAKARLLGGFLAPRGSARLTLESAEAGAVTIRLEGTAPVEPSGGALVERLPCEAVRASPAVYEPRDALTPARPSGGQPPPAPEGASRREEAIRLVATPLAAEPGGAPVAQLAAPEASPPLLLEASLLERRGGQARVVVPYRDGLVVGWVPASAVRRPPPAAAPAATSPFGRLELLRGLEGTGVDALVSALPAPRPIPGMMSCDADEALFVDREGVRAALGTLLGGQRFRVTAASGDATFVTLPGAAVHVEQPARLFVRTEDLAGCVAAPAE